MRAGGLTVRLHRLKSEVNRTVHHEIGDWPGQRASRAGEGHEGVHGVVHGVPTLEGGDRIKQAGPWEKGEGQGPHGRSLPGLQGGLTVASVAGAKWE